MPSRSQRVTWIDDAQPTARRTRGAVVRAHPDGTYGLRMSHFEPEHLAELKSEVDMSWDAESREWILWDDEARREATTLLRAMNFTVARR